MKMSQVAPADGYLARFRYGPYEILRAILSCERARPLPLPQGDARECGGQTIPGADRSSAPQNIAPFEPWRCAAVLLIRGIAPNNEYRLGQFEGRGDIVADRREASLRDVLLASLSG